MFKRFQGLLVGSLAAISFAFTADDIIDSYSSQLLDARISFEFLNKNEFSDFNGHVDNVEKCVTGTHHNFSGSVAFGYEHCRSVSRKFNSLTHSNNSKIN